MERSKKYLDLCVRMYDTYDSTKEEEAKHQETVNKLIETKTNLDNAFKQLEDEEVDDRKKGKEIAKVVNTMLEYFDCSDEDYANFLKVREEAKELQEWSGAIPNYDDILQNYTKFDLKRKLWKSGLLTREVIADL